MWRSLSLVQTGLGSLDKSIYFKSTLEAHDNDKSTSTRQQCKWISSLYVSTHKWYPISGTHEDSKCSRNGLYW